jgi:tRNA G26 N,N-dimethylase Trm1
MTIENMRGYLCAKYTGKRWEQKVNRMCHKQVFAIYMRILESEKKFVPHASAAASPKQHVYSCYDCGKEYIADNPELSSCRFCGGEVSSDYRITYIGKEVS